MSRKLKARSKFSTSRLMRGSRAEREKRTRHAKRKRLLVTLVLGSLALALGVIAACGKDDDSPLPGTVFYVPDHLGGPDVMTDTQGRVVGVANRDPWGAELANGGERYGINGKELDEDTGLYYMGSRWYDPKIGRFLTPDPAGLRPPTDRRVKDPQLLNPYSYARNSPASWIDPTGEDAIALYGNGDDFPGTKDAPPRDWFETGIHGGIKAIVESHNQNAVTVRRLDQTYPNGLPKAANSKTDELIIFTHGSPGGTLKLSADEAGERLTAKAIADFVRTVPGIQFLKIYACYSHSSGLVTKVRDDLTCRGGGAGCTPYPIKTVQGLDGKGSFSRPEFKGDPIVFKSQLKPQPKDDVDLSPKRDAEITLPPPPEGGAR